MTTLRLVTDKDRVLLRNLFNYFIHDLASYDNDAKLNKSGTFALDAFAQYIHHPGLKTFLIYFEEEIAGFIVISIPPYFSKSKDLYQVQHLFVLNGYRRRNIGSEAAEQVIQKYRGKWSISQIESNEPAINFWRAFYKKRQIHFEEEIVTIDDENMIFQNFVS